MFCLVSNNAVVSGPKPIPKNWKRYSNLHLLPKDQLAELGWYEAVLTAPPLPDEYTHHYGNWEFSIDHGLGVVTCSRSIVARTPEDLVVVREGVVLQKVAEVKQEALTRIKATIPTIDTYNEVALIALLWPGLNIANLGPELVYAKDVYLAAKQGITWLKNPARTLQELKTTTAADIAWPVAP